VIELGTAPAPQHSRDRTWVVALCFAAIVFDGYDLIVYGSAVPALLAKSDWSLTPAQVASERMLARIDGQQGNAAAP
jgi:AAHS family benzoate transporter-like MFS transporter